MPQSNPKIIDSQNQFIYCPIESSQYPFQPTSSMMAATVTETNAPAIPTPVKEKSLVKENWFKDCPNKSESKIDAATIPAKTKIAKRTFSHLTL